MSNNNVKRYCVDGEIVYASSVMVNTFFGQENRVVFYYTLNNKSYTRQEPATTEQIIRWELEKEFGEDLNITELKEGETCP